MAKATNANANVKLYTEYQVIGRLGISKQKFEAEYKNRLDFPKGFSGAPAPASATIFYFVDEIETWIRLESVSNFSKQLAKVELAISQLQDEHYRLQFWASGKDYTDARLAKVDETVNHISKGLEQTNEQCAAFVNDFGKKVVTIADFFNRLEERLEKESNRISQLEDLVLQLSLEIGELKANKQEVLTEPSVARFQLPAPISAKTIDAPVSEKDTMLKISDVALMVGMSKTKIAQYEALGVFPRHEKLNDRLGTRVWKMREIKNWLNDAKSKADEVYLRWKNNPK